MFERSHAPFRDPTGIWGGDTNHPECNLMRVVYSITRWGKLYIYADDYTLHVAAVSKTSKLSKKSNAARVPLRELTEEEIFERDEATLGDLRRRRSGEHSGTYIEFDSHTWELVEAADLDAIVDAEDMESSVAAPDTTATTVDDNGRIRVLRRTDSEESLRKKVEAIMAATTASTTARKPTMLRKKLFSPMKLKHPAVRGDTANVSLDRHSLSPSKQAPILGRQSAATIGKSVPAPSQRSTRMGLGSKTANTILKEAISSSKENAPVSGTGKKIIISSANGTVELSSKQKMPVLGKKSVNNSLRRAAGSSRTNASGVKTGPETMRRMR